MRSRLLLAAVMVSIGCAHVPPAATSAPDSPRVTIKGPRALLMPLTGPADVLVRVAVTGLDCFGLVVYWGDGETSGWGTCDETSWSKSHRYKAPGRYEPAVSLLDATGKQVAVDHYTLEIY